MMVLRNPTTPAMPGHRRKSSSDGENPAFEAPLRALEAGLREHDLRRTAGYRRGPLPGGPTLVRHGHLQLLISSAPPGADAVRYAAHLRAQNVRHVVRVCEPTYAAALLRGIDVHDWVFPDGEAPPPPVIARWLALLDAVFDLAGGGAHARDEVVAVHCMAGLGRAPVLVAIALIEAGAHPFEAVGTIRAQRRGAINARQMAFLEAYVPRREALKQSPRSHSPARQRRQAFGFMWMKRGAHRQSQIGVAQQR